MIKQLKLSPVYLANLYWLIRYKIVANQGGTRSGKTFNIIWLLDDLAETAGKGIDINGNKIKLIAKDNLKISVVSQTMSHLEDGAIADFKTIKRDIKGNWNDGCWRNGQGLKSYTYANGSVIQFFSVDKEGKARGRKRDILYANEINKGMKEAIWKQLALRTTGKILIDWNPSEPHHWIYDKITNRNDCKLLISTYLDNHDFLEQTVIDEIERYRETDPVFWKVFGEGQRGNDGAGNVFHGWKQIEYKNFPNSQKIFGIDFGYSNDPTALVELRKGGGNLYIKEWIYANPRDPKNKLGTGLNTRELIQELNGLKREGVLKTNSIIYADNSEPRTISDLQEAGFNVYPAKKGAGSIKAGIDFIKSYNQVYLDINSNNIWLEYDFYKYRPNPKALEAGVYLNIPIDAHNHAIDAIRYANEEWQGKHSLKTVL